MLELDLNKEVKELEDLDYRIKGKNIKYIYNHSEIIGYKIKFEIEKKVINSDLKEGGGKNGK